MLGLGLGAEYTRTTAMISGTIVNVIDMDGVDDTFDEDAPASIQTYGGVNNGGTICFWVMIRTSPPFGSPTLIMKRRISTGNNLTRVQMRMSNVMQNNGGNWEVTNRQLMMSHYSVGGYNTPDLELNTWYHLAMTWRDHPNGGGGSLVANYKDGVRYDYYTNNTGQVGNQTGSDYKPWSMGSGWTASGGSTTNPVRYGFMDGQMTQVGFFNSALTEEAVADIYNNGKPRGLDTSYGSYDSSSLVTYYDMSEIAVGSDHVEDMESSNHATKEGAIGGTVTFF